MLFWRRVPSALHHTYYDVRRRVLYIEPKENIQTIAMSKTWFHDGLEIELTLLVQ